MQLCFSRRLFLKHGLGGLLLAALRPVSALAAWPAGLFSRNRLDETLTMLFAGRTPTDSGQIGLIVPEIAENGAVVPVTISSELADIRKLYLLVENNPTPLVAEFELAAGVPAYVAARIKMAESSHVLVIADCGSQLLQTRQWVTVMVGGCGSG